MALKDLEQITEIVGPPVDLANPDWCGLHIYTHRPAAERRLYLTIYGLYRDMPYVSSFPIPDETLSLIENGDREESMKACESLVDATWKRLKEVAKQDGIQNINAGPRD